MKLFGLTLAVIGAALFLGASDHSSGFFAGSLFGTGLWIFLHGLTD